MQFPFTANLGLGGLKFAASDEPTTPAVAPEAFDYAENHKTFVFRSNEAKPERFKDLKPATEPFLATDYLVPADLSGSSFQGGVVNRANYEVFSEEFFGHEGVQKLTGGHSSYGVAIRLDSLTDEILETLKALEEYPSLDDDKTSELEATAIKDAWFDWAHYDFMRALERKFPDQEDSIYKMPEEKALRLFDELRGRMGAEWVIESGGKAYIEVNRVAEAADEKDL